MNRWRRLFFVLLLAPALALPAACARIENPATGEREFTMLSPAQEQQIGQQEHPRILTQFGGEYDDPELQAYVDQIGNRLAQVAELPAEQFTFTLLNSDVVNAFALPGGYVYITRGLVALAENEAELAGVIGHEIGHVTGRHAAQRQTQATGAGILATLGTIGAAIFGGETAAELVQQVAGVGAQAWVASYSRDQELEADRLGIRYLSRAGYEPQAMATFLEKLNGQAELEQALSGRQGDPGLGWFATHPRTLDRVQQAIDEVGEPAGDGRIAREDFLARIDGMIYGEDPAQGFVRDREFIHPELGFAFQAPPGFQMQNTPAAVVGRDREGRTMLFTLANPGGMDLERYVAGPGLGQIGQMLNVEVSQPRAVRTFKVDGRPAASASASLRQQGGTADLGLAAIDAGERAYQFVFITPGSMSRNEAQAFHNTVTSFRSLGREEAARYRPQRIAVAAARGGADPEDFARRMAVDDAPLERFRLLNALALADGLQAGEQVKLIVE